MNKIEKQILLNQVDIMRCLLKRTDCLALRLQETSDLLNPKAAEEDCCDMSEGKFVGCSKEFDNGKAFIVCGVYHHSVIQLCDDCKEKFVKRGLRE